jgi:hypothetical protein
MDPICGGRGGGATGETAGVVTPPGCCDGGGTTQPQPGQVADWFARSSATVNTFWQEGQTTCMAAPLVDSGI